VCVPLLLSFLFRCSVRFGHEDVAAFFLSTRYCASSADPPFQCFGQCGPIFWVRKVAEPFPPFFLLKEMMKSATLGIILLQGTAIFLSLRLHHIHRRSTQNLRPTLLPLKNNSPLFFPTVLRAPFLPTFMPLPPRKERGWSPREPRLPFLSSSPKRGVTSLPGPLWRRDAKFHFIRWWPPRGTCSLFLIRLRKRVSVLIAVCPPQCFPPFSPGGGTFLSADFYSRAASCPSWQ